MDISTKWKMAVTKWTEKDILFIKDNLHLSNAELAKHLGSTADAICQLKVRKKLNRLQNITLEDREWRTVTELPDYEVSDHGEVRNKKRGNILRSRVDKNGYYKIEFKLGTKTLNRNIHRLLALEFIDNPNNEPEVNHEDGNKLNNYWENLEWVSSSYNMQHAHDNGLINMPKGDDHWTRKRNVKQFVGRSTTIL
jgi:hypothetical protein